MRIDLTAKAIGLVLTYFSAAFLAPLTMALHAEDLESSLHFIVSCVITFAVGFTMYKATGKDLPFSTLKKKEALFIVAFSWILTSIMASIPYLLRGIPFADSIFEATSGISTCGASVLSDLESYPRSLLLWRSMTQWIGGLGIIVIFIAVLPQFAVAGRQMFFAESASPNRDKLAPRMQFNAINILVVYLILTTAAIISLHIAGMPFFESVCNTFSMVSAGGLSPSSTSISQYQGKPVAWVCIFFMFLSGVNFSLQYKLFFQRNAKSLLRSSEFIAYVVIVAISSFLIVVFITLDADRITLPLIGENIKNALFHSISIMTSTGFYTVNHDAWDAKAKIVLMLLMFVGASAGSAGGGIKVIRIIYAFKFLKREFSLILHPKAVIPIKLDGRAVSESTGQQIISFIFFYFMFFAGTAALIAMLEDNIYYGTITSAVTIGNTGLGFDAFGPSGSFAGLTATSKIVLSLAMIIGRLELIPILVMFSPDYWKMAKRRKTADQDSGEGKRGSSKDGRKD